MNIHFLSPKKLEVSINLQLAEDFGYTDENMSLETESK